MIQNTSLFYSLVIDWIIMNSRVSPDGRVVQIKLQRIKNDTFSYNYGFVLNYALNIINRLRYEWADVGIN